MAMEVISLVEKGWQGVRRVAFQLQQAGITTHHLVRGRLPRDLLEVLTSCKGMVLTGITPTWYRWAVWWVLIRSQWRRQVMVVLVDNERTARWVERWFPTLEAHVFLVQETAEGFPLLFQQNVRVEVGALLALGAR